MTIKLIKTDSELLEKSGSKVVVGEVEYFYLPYWYKKVSDDLYEEVRFENLPTEVIEFLMQKRENP